MPRENLTVKLETVGASGAQVALAAAAQAAASKNLKVSIAVVDNAGNLCAFLRADGAPITTIEAAMRKARSAAQLGAPTKVFEDLLRGGMTPLLALEFLCPLRGGIPIILEGGVIGGIGASGGTGDEDEIISNAGAAALLDSIANPGVAS